MLQPFKIKCVNWNINRCMLVEKEFERGSGPSTVSVVATFIFGTEILTLWVGKRLNCLIYQLGSRTKCVKHCVKEGNKKTKKLTGGSRLICICKLVCWCHATALTVTSEYLVSKTGLIFPPQNPSYFSAFLSIVLFLPGTLFLLCIHPLVWEPCLIEPWELRSY